MALPLSVRVAALFARDKYAFWWNHFTDEERKLRRMDVMELAAALHESQVRQDNQRRIVIEYMLSSRLARLQSKASWGSGVLGFAGAVLGAALTVAATMATAPSASRDIHVTCASPSQPPPSSSAVKEPSGSALPSSKGASPLQR